ILRTVSGTSSCLALLGLGLRLLLDRLLGLRRLRQHPAHRSLKEDVGLGLRLSLGGRFGHGENYRAVARGNRTTSSRVAAGTAPLMGLVTSDRRSGRSL